MLTGPRPLLKVQKKYFEMTTVPCRGGEEVAGGQGVFSTTIICFNVGKRMA